MTRDNNANDDDVDKERRKHKSFDMIGWFVILIIIFITIFTCPSQFKILKVTLIHVWYYGWITAISTGLGAVPFIFLKDLNKNYMGYANALAGGMMIAASYSLAYEGSVFTHSHTNDTKPIGNNIIDNLVLLSASAAFQNTLVGFASGILFILVTKKFLDQFDDLKFGAVDRVSAEKMILIIFVMTLHSLTEGNG